MVSFVVCDRCVDLVLLVLIIRYMLLLVGRVNICPFQGSRTIRTEEAILISLARLSPFVAANSNTEADVEKAELVEANVEFSDESPSDESSSGSNSSDDE